MITPEYYEWWSRRVNENISGPREECVRSIEEHLQVVPPELEIIKQDSLKTDYKKLRLSIRMAGLGKTSEQ
ncbi:hypothetical protein Goari_026835 [Gossypium aridum]|uniref:Uncharacterized protein n=1 Tax=Gossypium aridum TaxID=34290 RepID=A0A7J8YUM2_GOSAI|nr:hypothetical protein [Gossypium aridum]